MSNWGDPYQPTPPQQPSAPAQAAQPYAQPQPQHYVQPPAPAQPQVYAQPYGVPPARAFHEAELDAMHRAADKQARIIRVVLAVVLPVFILLRSGGGVTGVLASVAIVAAVLVGAWIGVVVSRRSTRGRHDAVVAGRPGLDVLEVWGARGLHAALKAAGIAPTKVRKSAATSLSMVPSTAGVELWTGRGSTAAALVAVPWSAVAAIDETRGSITNDGTRPALMLVTAIGQRLVFVPRTRPDGGRVAKVPELRALVARLDALRAGALSR